MTFDEWYRVYLKAKHENYFGSPSEPIDDVKAAWDAAFEEGVKWTLKQDANTLNKLQLTLEQE